MIPDLRWRDYVLRSGDAVPALWDALVSEKERNVLYILGRGFDQRMCLGAEMVLPRASSAHVCVLEFPEGPESASRMHGDLREANDARLNAFVKRIGCEVSERMIALVSEQGHRVGGRNVAREFKGPADFESYTDVVVDISALPRGLYFPLLAKLLTIFDQDSLGSVVRNLHVLVAHSPIIDAATVDDGLDDNASFLHGFSAAEFEREATKERPKVWIPILGRRQRAQLERIYELVGPDEICPLLPSPSQNPREADDLMFVEYRDLLLDQLRVEPRNVIYAAEGNPFEVYRQIMRCVTQYNRALASLSGCKAVISAMSSKLASIGGLLAAYELRRPGPEHVDVGVAHVEAQGYRVDIPQSAGPTTIHHLWLSGECYAL